MSSAAEFVASRRAYRVAAKERQRTQVFATVEVHRCLAAVDADWAELEALAPASVYQTRAFLVPWLETLGAARGIDPFFVVAKDLHERPLALLCLGIQRRAWFRAGVFLGGKESNFNFGLFRPGAHFSAADLRDLLRSVTEALGPDAPHIFILKNQPFAWDGAQNPLAQLPHVESASCAYATNLASDAAAFLTRKISKDSWRKLRRKEARLAEQGSLDLISGDTPESVRRILDAFFLEKIRRCHEKAMSLDVASMAMRAFLDRLSLQTAADGRTWFELYGLTLDGRVIATYAGAAHNGHFSAMLNSFDGDETVAKSSPGNLLLTKLIATQCARKRTSFDLGIGEAAYKMTYCDTKVPLFDAVVPVSTVGYLLAVRQVICSKLKVQVKQRPGTFALLRRLKRYFARESESVAQSS